MVSALAVDRFRADLNALIEPGSRIAVAVSGGPDSMALLLLAAAEKPGEVEAATVDHGLREGSRAEAEMVANACAGLTVPHVILTVDWTRVPTSGIQERARSARYAALAEWMRSRGIDVLLTAHHLDDQAETVLMRLTRGAGAKGLAGMRGVSDLPGAPDLKLIRPLLKWRRHELQTICNDSGVMTAADPSNDDERYERVRIRQALSNAKWLDAEAVVRSAENLASGEDAVAWAASREWDERVTVGESEILYTPSDAPAEIVRRVVSKAIASIGVEGRPDELRGQELGRLIARLRSGGTATLRGVRCRGGDSWNFARANPRTN
jgi:tRNA(Ile)-lysidine synthase